MSIMHAALSNAISSLPCRATSGIADDVTVTIREMEWRDILSWHREVQPMIDRHFHHWTAGADPRAVRADVGWDWRKIFGLMLLHNTACFIPGNQSSLGRALVVAMQCHSGQEIPIGMVTVVPQFLCRVQGVEALRTFVWYLADAPAAVYRALEQERVALVAGSLIDTAIQTGLQAGTDGSLVLHADPNGGQRLMDYYVRNGLVRMPVDSEPISTLRRSRTDQYFCFDAAGSARFRAKFDMRRPH